MTDLGTTLQSSLADSYTIERELGGGGMSRVWLATETSLGRRVVLKVLPSPLAHALSADRFRQEIRVAARLSHPHIVPLLAAGTAGELLYYSMPFIEGDSLRARLQRGGELPVREAVRVLRDVAAALAYAHEQGLVHRDIKPDNVLLAGGEALVTDFGVAKALAAASTMSDGALTVTGLVLGTPAYMAPEQAAADPQVDHRADIYAWGCLAYECLSGQPPFAGRPAAAQMVAHAVEVPDPLGQLRPSVPPGLATLVDRCLAKGPADRPQTARELLEALEALAVPSGESASTTPRAARPQRSRRAALATVGLVVLLIAALAAGYVA
ncbi:MAG TPA: serine/threonine-protein kinase, partial [Planctomycetota bacterium]|nr:serine/threonine-protein kinase [Planctomycetota bacterium]